MNVNTLDPQINTSPRSNRDHKSINTALQLIEDALPAKKLRDNKNYLIQRLFEEGFEVSEPNGPRKLTSQMLYQAMWRFWNKLKMLDFQVYGTGRPQEMRYIVTQGVATVLRKGEFISSLTGKGGGFMNMGLYGNGFLMFGANPDMESKIPLKFMPISNSNLYVDPYATSIRIGGMGRAAQRACAIFSMSWGQAIKLFPKLKKVGTSGRIPRDLQQYKEIERDFRQTTSINKRDETEIAFFWDLSSKTYTIFGGSTCALLDEYRGENYPFVLDDEPYLPVFQLTCIPSSEGFYDHGIGDLVYRLAIVSRQLMNMQIGYVQDNTYPITLVNVPNSESASFFEKLFEANLMRESGQKGFVAMEYDPNNPNAGRVSSETLLTQNLTNQWQSLFDRLDRELRRIGINLDDIDYNPDALATQIMAQEENSNALVKQIMEWNAPEIEWVLKLTMDMMTKFIPKNDKTPIDLPVMVKIGDQEVDVSQFTLGMVADELKKNNYFVQVNSRSGSIPSNVAKIAANSRLMQVTPPGTEAFARLQEDAAQMYGYDFKKEDFMPPQQQAPAAPEGSPEEAPIPSETDRLQINAEGLKNPQPAF